MAITIITPVSYTHLDVYKRQHPPRDDTPVPRRAHASPLCRGPPPSAGPVSYTHLVVRPDKREVEFTYDALGRRLSKSFGTTVTRWQKS